MKLFSEKLKVSCVSIKTSLACLEAKVGQLLENNNKKTDIETNRQTDK